MRLCFIVDARSPTSQNWMTYFVRAGHEVAVISTYPVSLDVMPGAEVTPMPIGFSGLSSIRQSGPSSGGRRRSPLAPLLASARAGKLAPTALTLRNWIVPLEIERHAGALRAQIVRLAPDLVHAMRIPFEGMVAARATPLDIPLVTSVWGNDFTLHARYNPIIAWQTRRAMRRTTALHCDCRRDRELAEVWGFDRAKPSLVVPGAGGIHTECFRPGLVADGVREQLRIPLGAPVVLNPRGFRGYVRNDMFFQAIPRVLASQPETMFVCSSMAGNPVAERWIDELGIASNVRLMPYVPHQQMAEVFKSAQVVVSPSDHDGTPNTLLEAMACGCFPVAGDIESVREWITDGHNGLLCDPANPGSIAQAILQAIQDQDIRRAARAYNLQLVHERADYRTVMPQAEAWYNRLVQEGKDHRKGTTSTV